MFTTIQKRTFSYEITAKEIFKFMQKSFEESTLLRIYIKAPIKIFTKKILL